MVLSSRAWFHFGTKTLFSLGGQVFCTVRDGVDMPMAAISYAESAHGFRCAAPRHKLGGDVHGRCASLCLQYGGIVLDCSCPGPICMRQNRWLSFTTHDC